MKVKGLFDFISATPTAFHTVDEIKRRLAQAGFSEFSESDCPEFTDGHGYFTTRNASSVIAFRYNKNSEGFMICASHSDTPAFRVKMNSELSSAYERVAVEKYGGMIHYTWLDRPLSVAGRAVVETECGIKTVLVDLDRPVLSIPSVAIHLRRTVNDGVALNPAVDMIPLVSDRGGRGISELVAEKLGVNKNDILSHDLFVYVKEEPKLFGADNEFVLSPRLDDAGCVYASLDGFLSADASSATPVLAVFDNEEVGSETKQGASSTFLHDTLALIAKGDLRRMLGASFMVSADNGHAVHPNHPELSDAKCAPVLNGGVVIKYNASQRYATDGVSSAVFEKICKRASVPVQYYYNRADLPGGSTLGSISDTKVSIPTVDIGLPELAMHSAVETVGAKDVEAMVQALREFFSSALIPTADGYNIAHGK